MDNRRVAKVYRENSQRVKKLPFPAPSGLLSKVKRYFSGSSLPSRVSLLKNESTGPETGPVKEASFTLPDSFSAANETALAHGSEDLNRILLSFFQEKGSQPLSQVEYEGVMSLLDRSKASVTLPLPELTPEPKKPRVSAANGPENGANNTFALYSQKVLRNTSGYGVSDVNNSSVLTADYRPVYHTFNDVSRGNISMKRVYPFSGVPSPYRTRIKAPNLAARKQRRIVSAAPLIALADSVSEAATQMSTSFRPKSKTANSLLLILDGNTETQNDEGNASVVDTKPAGKSLHNPYAKIRRFTPLQKDDIVEQLSSPVKADEISKTVSYNKAEELSSKDAFEKSDSLFGNSSKPTAALPSFEKVGSQEKSQSSENGPEVSKPAFSFGASKPSSKGFGLPDASSATSPGIFGNNANASGEEPVLKSTNGNTPAFSFGKPSSPTKANVEEEKPNLTPSLFAKSDENKTQPSFQFGAAKTDSPAFSFGAKPKSDEFTEKASEITEKPKPLFSFGAKPEAEKPAFSFSSKLTEEKPSISFGATSSAPKPAFSFGLKKDETAKKDVETIEIESEEEEPEPQQEKPKLFDLGVKPATSLFGNTTSEKPETQKPAFSFGAKPYEDKSTPAFNFGSKPAEEKSASSKPAFSFGAKPADEKPALDFGLNSSEESKEKSSAFNFGSKPIDKPAPSFSFGAKAAEEKTAPKPVFNFGAKPSEDKSGEETPSSKPAFTFGSKAPEEKPAAKPAFNFGSKTTEDKPASAPAFSFGSKPAEDKPSAKPAFSFGSKPVEEKSTAAPAFSFGAKSTLEKPVEETPAAKSTFNFGAKPADENPADKPAFSFGAKSAEEKPVSAPSFSFGSKAAEDKPAAKPAFSFGAKPSEVKPVSAPGFSFGSKPTEDTPAPKPAFNFGAKPAFSFGKPSESNADKPDASVEATSSEEKSQDKPAFSFGTSATEKPSFGSAKQPVNDKPAFTFGNKPADGKPAFSFGSSIGGKPSESNEPTNKPAFLFGSKPVANDADSSVDKPQTPAFSFGSKPSEKSAFSFGTKANDAKPAFSFGAASADKTVGSNGFSGNGTTGLSLENQFEFPPAPVQQANLNQEKVKEYEDLFQF